MAVCHEYAEFCHSELVIRWRTMSIANMILREIPEIWKKVSLIFSGASASYYEGNTAPFKNCAILEKKLACPLDAANPHATVSGPIVRSVPQVSFSMLFFLFQLFLWRRLLLKRRSQPFSGSWSFHCAQDIKKLLAFPRTKAMRWQEDILVKYDCP